MSGFGGFGGFRSGRFGARTTRGWFQTIISGGGKGPLDHRGLVIGIQSGDVEKIIRFLNDAQTELGYIGGLDYHGPPGPDIQYVVIHAASKLILRASPIEFQLPDETVLGPI